MCWGHERESASFYTFLAVIKTITTSLSRVSRLKSSFTCRSGKFQSHRSHLLSLNNNTATQGDTVYSDGSVLILRRNLLPSSKQYIILRLRKQNHQVNVVANCQTTRHHTPGNRKYKVVAKRISLLDYLKVASSLLDLIFHKQAQQQTSKYYK